MSVQTENFKKLVKGNSLSKIVQAINMLQSGARNELMKEYNVSSVEALATKLM